jgi:hypothetical protein
MALNNNGDPKIYGGKGDDGMSAMKSIQEELDADPERQAITLHACTCGRTGCRNATVVMHRPSVTPDGTFAITMPAASMIRLFQEAIRFLNGDHS